MYFLPIWEKVLSLSQWDTHNSLPAGCRAARLTVWRRMRTHLFASRVADPVLDRIQADMASICGSGRDFREVQCHSRVSGRRRWFPGDSRNIRETWDVCFSCHTWRQHSRELPCPNSPELECSILCWKNCSLCVEIHAVTPHLQYWLDYA